jgi:YegS/Rv2252/BmrU family lipid kinase
MRWTAVVNPAAGRGRTRRAIATLVDSCGARGVEVHVARDRADGERAARAAFADGRGVVACGGDGTVSELAAVAAECGGPLAIVPTGSGNDFARHFGIDGKRPLDALALLDHGHEIRCDLGRVRAADGASCRFTTVAHTGFDAEANRWANTVQWTSGTTLYVIAVMRTLATYRPRPLRLTTTDAAGTPTVWEGPAWLVAAGNTRYYAGGMMITPDARADDGLLDVCVIGPVPTAKFLVRFPRVFSGRHVEVAGVETFRGRTVEIEPVGPGLDLDVYASGERVGPLGACVETDPGALRLITPPS